MRHRCCVFVGLGLTVAAIGMFTIGCGSSSSNAQVRLVNANPDQSGLTLLIDSNSAASGISYGSASSYISVSAASHELAAEPSNSSTSIIDTTLTFSSGSNVTLISANYSYSVRSIVLNDDNSLPSSGNFKLRIVNCSPGMGSQDVYIVSSGTDINSASPVFSSLDFASGSSYVTLAAGSYDVVFTPPGSKFVNLKNTYTISDQQIRTALSLNDPVGSYEGSIIADKN